MHFLYLTLFFSQKELNDMCDAYKRDIPSDRTIHKWCIK